MPRRFVSPSAAVTTSAPSGANETVSACAAGAAAAVSRAAAKAMAIFMAGSLAGPRCPAVAASLPDVAGMTRPLWTCPRCGQPFVSPHMPHSCAVVPLEEHFARSEPAVRAAFEALLAAAREHGPVTVNVTKSRIALQARGRFAAV